MTYARATLCNLLKVTLCKFPAKTTLCKGKIV